MELVCRMIYTKKSKEIKYIKLPNGNTLYLDCECSLCKTKIGHGNIDI